MGEFLGDTLDKEFPVKREKWPFANILTYKVDYQIREQSHDPDLYEDEEGRATFLDRPEKHALSDAEQERPKKQRKLDSLPGDNWLTPILLPETPISLPRPLLSSLSSAPLPMDTESPTENRSSFRPHTPQDVHTREREEATQLQTLLQRVNLDETPSATDPLLSAPVKSWDIHTVFDNVQTPVQEPLVEKVMNQDTPGQDAATVLNCSTNEQEHSAPIGTQGGDIVDGPQTEVEAEVSGAQSVEEVDAQEEEVDQLAEDSISAHNRTGGTPSAESQSEEVSKDLNDAEEGSSSLSDEEESLSDQDGDLDTAIGKGAANQDVAAAGKRRSDQRKSKPELFVSGPKDPSGKKAKCPCKGGEKPPKKDKIDAVSKEVLTDTDDQMEEESCWDIDHLSSIQSVVNLQSILPKDSGSAWEDFVDHAVFKPKLSLENSEKITKDTVTLWEATGDKEAKYRCCTFTMNWPQKSAKRPSNAPLMTMMDEFHAMIHISGHHREEGPFEALDYICVTEDEINSWDNKKLLQTHATHEIHVVPSHTSHKEKEVSKETCQWLGMNVYQTREVHNGQAQTDNPHDEMCRSSLSQLFDSDPNLSGRQDVNFLSISLPLYTQPLDYLREVFTNHAANCIHFNRQLSLLGIASQESTQSPFPVESLSWGLVATVPTHSHTHRDTGKFSTSIQVVSGTKFWFLRDSRCVGFPRELVDVNPCDYRWTGLVLQPGHVLIMRPGVEHLVWTLRTLQDSIVTGGHFYASTTLGRSLKAGLDEHLHGKSSTNTEHLGSETVLNHLVHYYDRFVNVYEDTNTTVPLQYALPDDDNLGALLAMTLYPDTFVPQPICDSEGNEKPWVFPMHLKHDRARSKKSCVAILEKRPDLIDNVRDWMEVIKSVLECSLDSHSPEADGEPYWTRLPN
ncbi:hypothetical protein K439DRAFT_1615989 [Ramaria rubella]|nr:hypothetical protein K439DRAFT_1615989 [Ramaria rubella]